MDIRFICKEDNLQISGVIKRSLEEFGIAREGTVYTDKSTDHLFELFDEIKHPYNVLINEDGEVVGGCGIFPTQGLPVGYVEIVKLYIAPSARGKGYGEKLLLLCMKQAKEYGYENVYLETLHELAFAVNLYKKVGLEELNGPLGDSGHFACSIWLQKKL